MARSILSGTAPTCDPPCGPRCTDTPRIERGLSYRKYIARALFGTSADLVTSAPRQDVSSCLLPPALVVKPAPMRPTITSRVLSPQRAEFNVQHRVHHNRQMLQPGLAVLLHSQQCCKLRVNSGSRVATSRSMTSRSSGAYTPHAVRSVPSRRLGACCATDIQGPCEQMYLRRRGRETDTHAREKDG